MTDPVRDEVTRVLTAVSRGERQASEELLPLVYDKLHELAQRKMSHEPPGHTLQPTALVHEAYLRLLGDRRTGWNDRRHFYGAASEAMRRILVERARKYQRIKHGAARERIPLDEVVIEFEIKDRDELIDLDRALERMQEEDRRMYEVVMLRYFGGLGIEEVARSLDVSPSTVDREWRCAQLWLYDQLRADGTDKQSQSE
jgi:RNA polymerase sigma factor (TIGR02999 family)